MPRTTRHKLPAELFEAYEFWPIRVRLGKKHGFTWWARQNDSHEYVLAIGTSALLGRTKKGLAKLTLESHDLNFRNHSGFQQIRAALANSGKPSPLFTPDASCDCTRVITVLHQHDWSRWSLPTCAAVLNCWNLLEDFARTTDDQATLEAMRPGSPVVALLNFLTFMEKPERSVLNDLDKPLLRATFAVMLERIGQRVLVVK